MADSNGSLGGKLTGGPFCQSSFDATMTAPSPLRNSSVGLASALGTPLWVRLGPIPRSKMTSSLNPPPRIKPAITMSLPVPTNPRGC